MARWTALLMLVVLALVTRPALAQEDPKDRAAELFQQSAEHYKAGRFDKAIELLTEAYTITNEPVLLYNLARAYEGNGDLDKALTAYRNYLARAEEVKDRGAIERRIATLEQQIVDKKKLEREAEEARRRAAEAERDKPKPTASPIPWAIAGVGAAGLVAATVLGVLALGREGDGSAAPNQVEADALKEEGETFATAANITFVVGGALLLGGAAWGIADIALLPDDEEESSAHLILAPSHVRFELRFQ